MRQFIPDEEGLVYRRHGYGPAYRVTEEQAGDFLAQYMRATRRARAVLLFLTLSAGAASGLLLAQAAASASDAPFAIFAIANVLVLVGGYVWTDLRNQSRPDRELSAGSLSTAPPLEEREWMHAQLAKVPWIHFAGLPLVGLFVVWALRGSIDPFAGWGRLIWLVPAALFLLAASQAGLKWRAIRRG